MFDAPLLEVFCMKNQVFEQRGVKDVGNDAFVASRNDPTRFGFAKRLAGFDFQLLLQFCPCVKTCTAEGSHEGLVSWGFRS